MSGNEGIELEQLQNIKIDDFKKLNPNSFPFWVFPKVLQNIVLDAVDCLNFPIDFLSSSIFFTCGLANGLATKIEITKEWTETTAMYLVIVGRAGTNKSHPLSFALKPIQTKDNYTFNQFQKEFENFDTEGKKPILKKVLTSDATVEAVAEVHNNNKKGIGVYSDELKGWISNMNKYNSGSDTEFWLSSWSGKSIVIDRKSSKPINIPQSFTSVIGSIQNKILIDVTGGKNSDNGFTDRLLFVIPKNIKKLNWSEKEISNLTLENYSNIINRILDQKIEYDDNENLKPLIVKYTPKALLVLKNWQSMNVNRYNDIANAKFGGVYSKMETYINRFALILQLMIDACDMVNINKVDERAVNGAIEITEYFTKQAIEVKNETIKTDTLFKDRVKQNFYNDLPASFKTSQAKEIGKEKPHNLGEKYIERMLKNKQLFIKISHGCYTKSIL